MKWMILLFLAALGAMYYYHTQHPYDASKSTPVVYTKSLQSDVQKADEAAKKATAAMANMNQQVQKAGKEDSPASAAADAAQ
jgi:hypothetical protein